ncbi:MAG: hypothetical protein QNJ54_24030 [Prochloraceae cyanobacterium]|nr:hypothetical protein [Prochloraceae cyanobacterium]
MTQIICLANSNKLKERCIAGINPQTGQWIRPVCTHFPHDGRVPQYIRTIDGKEPQLLDIIEIPLENEGPDFGFESENLTIIPGKWRIVGKIKPIELIQYCHNYSYILHNSNNFVTVTFLRSLPFLKRKTLQLVYATKLSVQDKINSKGETKWRGSLLTETGQQLRDLPITDPAFLERLKAGNLPKNPCLVTVSLGMPYRPLNWEGDDPCWKLIAGVIELSNFDLILVEMKRLGWTIERGRDRLQEMYSKRSRRQLTETELTEFLNYLKSLNET